MCRVVCKVKRQRRNAQRKRNETKRRVERRQNTFSNINAGAVTDDSFRFTRKVQHTIHLEVVVMMMMMVKNMMMKMMIIMVQCS